MGSEMCIRDRHTNVYSYIESPAAFHTDTSYMRPFIQVAHNHNWVPRGYSLFDAGEDEYEFIISADKASNVGYPMHWNAAGDSNAAIETSAGGGNSYIGSSSLRWRMDFGSPGSVITFANSSIGTLSSLDSFGIKIPKGKRWILSAYVKSNTASAAGANFRTYLYGGNTTLSLIHI